MDDVLDNICTVYNSWSDHRFILVLVSEIMPSCSFPTEGVPLIDCWSNDYAWWQRAWNHDAYIGLISCFFSRLPFYYELKIAFMVWLLSPYTKGSSVLYRKFVHPTLSSKEKVCFWISIHLYLVVLWVFFLINARSKQKFSDDWNIW